MKVDSCATLASAPSPELPGGQGEQPSHLAGVLTGPRKPAKLNRVVILAKCNNWHGETLRFRHRILLRCPRESPESDTAPAGITLRMFPLGPGVVYLPLYRPPNS